MNVWQKYLKYEQIKPVDAAYHILSGFQSTDEAEEYLEAFHDREVVIFTAHGYAVSPKELSEAIKIMRIAS